MESKQNPNNLVLEDRYELTEIIGGAAALEDK